MPDWQDLHGCATAQKHACRKIFIGSIPGIIIGSLLAVKVPAAFLRMAITLILAVVGLKMLLS